MDPTLASIYNTLDPVEVSDEEIQKTAQLQLLEKIAEANGVNLAELTDDQIVEAYNYLQDAEPEQVKTAAAEPQAGMPEGMSKEAQEMFQNADAMGRISAHAYVDELKQIQKAAMLKEAAEEGEEEKKEEKSANPFVAAMQAKKEEKKEEEGKEKDAWSQAVEKRAYDILTANGLVREDGTIVSPDELDKTAEENTQVEVDTAALKTLESMGYPIDWKNQE